MGLGESEQEPAQLTATLQGWDPAPPHLVFQKLEAWVWGWRPLLYKRLLAKQDVLGGWVWPGSPAV